MRRTVPYAAVLTATSLLLGSAPARADRRVTPSSAQNVVPWRQVPPRSEPTVPLPDKVTKPCRAGHTSVVSVHSGIWHGWVVTVTLRGKGPSCLVPRVVRVLGRRADGVSLRLHLTQQAAAVVPPLRPSAGKDGEVDLNLAMPYCTRKDGSTFRADPRRQVTHAALTLASGQTISLPGQWLNDSCGLYASLTRTSGDLDTSTVPRVQMLPGWGDLRATGPLPPTLVRGSTARFNVTLRNATSRPFSLATCPNWTITFAPFATKGESFYRAQGRLNCAAAPRTIPPYGEVTFAMRYRVPLRVPTGVAGFSWQLDQTNAWTHSYNPTTGDALVT